MSKQLLVLPICSVVSIEDSVEMREVVMVAHGGAMVPQSQSCEGLCIQQPVPCVELKLVSKQ